MWLHDSLAIELAITIIAWSFDCGGGNGQGATYQAKRLSGPIRLSIWRAAGVFCNP